MTHRIQASFLLAALLFTGCDMFSDPPGGELVPGIVEWQAETDAAAGGAGAEDDVVRATIEVPDTVDAGVPFNAVITTIGLSGCWSAEGAEVDSQGVLAVVSPRDVVAEGFCAGVLVDLPRDVALTFDVAGTGTIRVEGRRVVGFDYTNGMDATVERTVVVR